MISSCSIFFTFNISKDGKFHASVAGGSGVDETKFLRQLLFLLSDRTLDIHDSRDLQLAIYSATRSDSEGSFSTFREDEPRRSSSRNSKSLLGVQPAGA